MNEWNQRKNLFPGLQLDHCCEISYSSASWYTVSGVYSRVWGMKSQWCSSRASFLRSRAADSRHPHRALSHLSSHGSPLLVQSQTSLQTLLPLIPSWRWFSLAGPQSYQSLRGGWGDAHYVGCSGPRWSHSPGSGLRTDGCAPLWAEDHLLWGSRWTGAGLWVFPEDNPA